MKESYDSVHIIEKKKIKDYKLIAVFKEIFDDDPLAKENDYIEVTEWFNGEGFDVNVFSFGEQRFHMTWGQFKVLKKMVKQLDKLINKKIKNKSF